MVQQEYDVNKLIKQRVFILETSQFKDLIV